MTGVRTEPAPAVRSARARRIATLVATALVVASCGANASPPTTPSGDGLVSVGAGLKGLAGLEATAYAHALPNVAALARDPQGRMWAATADYTDKGNDGVFVVAKPGAPPVKVVAGMHTPLGLLWYHDSLYVASAGRVEAFGDFDGVEVRHPAHDPHLCFGDGTEQRNRPRAGRPHAHGHLRAV